jgi:sugar/nucleoside kinase (ribokinase family)
MEMPVSRRVVEENRSYKGGDTTGCGDNFVGGVIASVVSQKYNGSDHPDLHEACCWGIVSGGFTCFYTGGTWFEEKPGEKLERIKPYYESYRQQITD